MKVFQAVITVKASSGREVHTVYLHAENDKDACNAVRVLLPELFNRAWGINVTEYRDTIICITSELRK